MSLEPGARLGPYEIVSSIGAGGMGQVFKARDTRLDRTVAIKVLPPLFAQDATLRQRFDREARTVGNLNHAHICVLYDIGEQDGLSFIVMEYLEGETLAARLSRGPLPVDEVIRYGAEIADALDRAHRHGVVHRDLKPANVMLTRGGAKLLDFGLARPPVETLFSSETRAEGDSPITADGVLVGTLQYMAPEQLEGGAIDARTDIFTFGALLYEMATAERAFPGANQANIIAAIMYRQPPPPSARQPLSPPLLDHIVERALAKDPEDRWQTARDVYLELKSPMTLAAPPVRAAPTLPIGWLLAGLAAAVAIIVGLLASAWIKASSVPVPAVRAVIPPPERMSFQLTGDFSGPPVIAPDGTAIVFAASDATGQRQLWLRRLDTLTPEVMPGTEGATFPFWSPDSKSVAFFAENKLKRFDFSGTSALPLCDAPSGRGGAWSPHGEILFAPTTRGGLLKVAAGGGSPVEVTSIENTAYSGHRSPQILPDGRHFLYLAVLQEDGRDLSAVFLGSLDGRVPQQLLRTRTQATYASGHLLFLRDHTLWAQPFELAAETLSGAPMAIARDVLEDPSIWRGMFSASDGGTLIYQNGQAGTQLTVLDRGGHEAARVGEPGIIFDLNASPDGTRVAINRGEPSDIWVYELSRGTSLRLTFDVRNETLPVWSPDGKFLAYNQIQKDGRISIMQVPSSGGAPRELHRPSDQSLTDWSRDDVLLLRQGELIMSPGDIWALPLHSSTPVALLQTDFAEYHARFSPDGRWISFVSNDSGRDEVYVMRFRMPTEGATPPRVAGDRVRVSTAGGVLPRWRGDGKELFYLAPDQQLMSALVDGVDERLLVKSVAPLFSLSPKPVGWVYDVLKDGRFIVNALGDEGRRPIVLVTDWTAALPRPGG